MKSSFGIRTVYIDCYDALGFFEENCKRVKIVMSAIGGSNYLKREWVSGRAGGGSWARTLRCVFETDLDPIHVKTMMLGLQYLDPKDVPDILPRDADTGLFRFANFDVFDVQEGSEESKGRFSRLLKQTAKKIEMAEVKFIGDLSDFLVACRTRLIETLDSAPRQMLLEIEQQILERLEAEESVRT
ncbi:MAG: hypothetical protein AM325_005090 [Candidatus Thorarchaeota archaeon SMTZ1-45]|nr:MAG: hypothetical protein AM325_06855 [Candidatus Thorarchaeota archaeon SMTZ1-45]